MFPPIPHIRIGRIFKKYYSKIPGKGNGGVDRRSRAAGMGYRHFDVLYWTELFILAAVIETFLIYSMGGGVPR